MTEQEVIIMKVKPHWSMFIVPGILALFILLFSIATFPPLMLLSVVVLVPKILRYVSVELVISSKRLHGKNGILNSDELDTPINRVNDISVTTPFLGKIFHYGNIMIQAGTKTYSFACIGNPTTVRETILQAAEEFENAKFEKQTRQLVGATERQTQMQMQMMEQQTMLQAQMFGQLSSNSKSTDCRTTATADYRTAAAADCRTAATAVYRTATADSRLATDSRRECYP